MSVTVVLAIAGAVIGALLLYAGAANQRVRPHPGPHRGWQAAGGLALVAALVLLSIELPLATAIFVWVTLAMLVWSVAPIVVALWAAG